MPKTASFPKRAYSPKNLAKLAGVLYLSLLPFGIFSFVIVPSLIQVPGDISATMTNLTEHELIFRLGTISHLISQVIVVFLALSMFRLFRDVNKNRALLMVVLVLLGLPVAVLNEVHNLAIIQLLEPEFKMTEAQLQAQVVLFLDMSRNGVLIAQIFWGLWLVPLGLLVGRSEFLPKLLGVPVIIAGMAYLFDSIMQLLLPGFLMISRFTFIFEMILPVWLLLRGVDVEKWHKLMHPEPQMLAEAE